MQESMAATSSHEMPPASDSRAATTTATPTALVAPPGDLDDPRVLQILTTEHWSLLSARSLVYNEAFSRAAMFLAFLSMSFVALGLVGPPLDFSREFLLLAAVVLFFDLAIGLLTFGRIVDTTTEDFRAIAGMNRIRHGYLDIAPVVGPYLSTSAHDDLRGVIATYSGASLPLRPGPANLWRGLTTTSGLVATIVSLVAGVLVGVLSLALVDAAPIAVALAVVATSIVFALLARSVWRSLRRSGDELTVRFPSPDESQQ